MTDIITILVALAITYVIKKRLEQRDSSFSKLTPKQLWVLSGTPILVACYAIAVAIKDYNIADNVLNILTSYKGALSGTDPNWDVAVVRNAIENLSPEKRDFWLMTEIYEGLAKLSALVVCICSFMNILKLFDRNKLPQISLQRLVLISMVIFVITTVFNLYRVIDGVPVLVERMGGSPDTSTNGLVIISVVTSIVIIALVWFLYVFYKKTVNTYLAAPSQPIAKEVKMEQSVREETKRCLYCGEEILAIAKKCKHCGEWIKEEDEIQTVEKQPESPQIVYIQCPACGEDVEEGTKICPHCNEPI